MTTEAGSVSGGQGTSLLASIRAWVRLIVVVLLSLILVPVQFLLALLVRTGPVHFFLPKIWNRLAAWMVGMRIIQEGQPTRDRPVLMVGNHLGYLDIVMLSAVTEAHFLSKAEVEHWPVFGLLAKLRGTRFIKRDPKQVKTQRSALQQDLDQGLGLILFPEGTSTAGLTVRPYKSSLFEAVVASDRAVTIQPFALFYEAQDGQPLIEMADRDRVAWFAGSPELVPHVWGLMKRRSLTVRIVWLEPFQADPGMHRKSLAEKARAPVAALVAARYPDGLARIAAFGRGG